MLNVNKNKINENKMQFKMVIVGNIGAGKSTFLSKFRGEEKPESYKPTVGVEFYSHEFSKSQNVNIWDVSGSEKYGNFLHKYFKRTDAFIIVLDASADPAEQASSWIKKIEEHLSRYKNPAKKIPAISFVLNKSDLVEAEALTMQLEQLSTLIEREAGYKENENRTPLVKRGPSDTNPTKLFHLTTASFVNNPSDAVQDIFHNTLKNIPAFKGFSQNKKGLQSQLKNEFKEKQDLTSQARLFNNILEGRHGQFDLKLLNQHKHTFIDRLLNLKNTHSWQKTLKEIRLCAMEQLKAELQDKHPDEAIDLLIEAREYRIFKEHRSNAFFKRIGSTEAQLEIDSLIKQQERSARELERLPHKGMIN